MIRLRKAIFNRKTLVFLDLEGTQASHEMIAIGAIKCSINKQGKIKKYYKPFKRLVKAKNRVGKVVEKITNLNDAMLKANGESFYDAMVDFKKYCGTSFKNSLFITFGSHDIRIIKQSMKYTFHCPTEICEHIIKNHYDFLEEISSFIKDDKNNPYSLINYCKLFEVELSEPAHDPQNDAINLAKLYDAYLSNKILVADEYKKLLCQFNHVPKCILEVLKCLKDGQTITPELYEEFIKADVDD